MQVGRAERRVAQDILQKARVCGHTANVELTQRAVCALDRVGEPARGRMADQLRKQ